MRPVLLVGLLLIGCWLSTAHVVRAQVPVDNHASAQSQLAERERQLKALQSQIATLRKQLGIEATQLLVDVTIIELSHAALKKARFDPQGKCVLHEFAKGAENRPPEPLHIVACEPNSRLMKQLEAWIAHPDRPAKVVETRTLVGPLDKEVYLNDTTGEYPVLVPSGLGSPPAERFYGTQCDLLGTRLDDGDLALRVRARDIEKDVSNTVQIADRTIPGVRITEGKKRVTIPRHGKVVFGGTLKTKTTTKRPATLFRSAETEVDVTERISVLSFDMIR